MTISKFVNYNLIIVYNNMPKRGISKASGRVKKGPARAGNRKQMKAIEPPTAVAPASRTIPTPQDQPALVVPSDNQRGRGFKAPSWKVLAGALGTIGLIGGVGYGMHRLGRARFGGEIPVGDVVDDLIPMENLGGRIPSQLPANDFQPGAGLNTPIGWAPPPIQRFRRAPPVFAPAIAVRDVATRQQIVRGAMGPGVSPATMNLRDVATRQLLRGAMGPGVSPAIMNVASRQWPTVNADFNVSI